MGWGLDGEKDTVILGDHVVSGKGRDNRAMQICLEASDIGSLEARAIMGRHYVFNDNKPRLAFKYLKSAADSGEMMAAQILGQVYMNGCCGFKEDWRESYKWFKKVADSGNRSSAYAMLEIGKLYERSKMYEYALVWYKKAADNDHSYAREDYEELLAEHPELDD